MTTIEQAFPLNSPVSIKGNPRTFKDSPAIVVGYDRHNVVVNFPSHYDTKAKFIFCPEYVYLINKQARLSRAAGYLESVIEEINHIGSSPKLRSIIKDLNNIFGELILAPEFSEDYHQAIMDCIDNTEIHSQHKIQIHLAMKRNGVKIELYQFDAAFKELLDAGTIFYGTTTKRWMISNKSIEQEEAEIEHYLKSGPAGFIRDVNGNAIPLPPKQKR